MRRRVAPFGGAALSQSLAAALLVGTLAWKGAGADAAHDWPRFGFDAAGTNSSTAEAGIAAADLARLRPQRVTLPGTVDASAIYLHAVTILGAPHDAFFVTTTYGITLAIDADSGVILWQHRPDGYESWVGSSQITTATPVADPDRAFIYAANPGGTIEKLAVRDGSAAWSTAGHPAPAPGEARVRAQLSSRARHRRHRRLHWRRVAVPGARRDHRRRERQAALGVELPLQRPPGSHGAALLP